MAKQKDFQADVPFSKDPVSPDSGLLIKAAEYEGAGKVARAKGEAVFDVATAGLATTVAGQGLNAYKGSLESQLEQDIKKTVDSYEARVKTDNAQVALDLFSSGVVDPQPAEVEAAKAQLIKFKDALDQGILTREQALMSIDKNVKDFSNRMPGWASDFRKLAYNITGVEHIGRYREHTLLTQQSAAEKDRQDKANFALKMQQQVISNFVQTYGRLPEGGWNGPDLNLFRAQLSIKARASELEAQLNVRDRTVAQNEPTAIEYVNHRMADGIMTLNSKLQGIVYSKDPKTGKPLAAEDKILLRSRILADIGSFFEKVKSEVVSFNTSQISQPAREQLLNRLNTQQEQLTTALKNQDTFDDFRKTMELRADQAKDITAKWSIANPHLLIIKESGMATPELARVWFDHQRDPRRQAIFRENYGGALDDYFKSLSTGGQVGSDKHAKNMSDASVSEEHLNALRLTDRGAYQYAMTMLRDHIKSIAISGWGDTQETQELRKMRLANNIKVFGSQIDFKDNSAVQAWTSLMADPRVAERVGELPQNLQNVAIDAIATKAREVIENPEFGTMARLQRLQASLGDSKTMSFFSSATHAPFELVFDPQSGQIKVQQYVRTLGGKTAPKKQYDIKKDSKGTPVELTEETILTDGGNLGFGEVKSLVATANRAVAILSNFGQQDRKLADDTVQKFNAGYFGMSPADREQALSKGVEASTKTKGPFTPDDKKIKNIENLSGKGVEKEIGKYSDADKKKQKERDALAGKIAAGEVSNDPEVIEANLVDLARELARRDLNSTVRQILEREYNLWQKAKESLNGQK